MQIWPWNANRMRIWSRCCCCPFLWQFKIALYVDHSILSYYLFECTSNAVDFFPDHSTSIRSVHFYTVPYFFFIRFCCLFVFLFRLFFFLSFKRSKHVDICLGLWIFFARSPSVCISVALDWLVACLQDIIMRLTCNSMQFSLDILI